MDHYRDKRVEEIKMAKKPSKSAMRCGAAAASMSKKGKGKMPKPAAMAKLKEAVMGGKKGGK